MNFLKKKTNKSRGFTLIEVIAILIVLGIIAAVAVSRLTMSGTELFTETDILRSNLRFAQYKALSNNDAATTTWGISFTGGTYTLQRNGATAAISFPSDGSATHTLSAGVTLTAPASVTYDFWGSPGAADIGITLSQSGVTTAFIITRITGFIP